MSPAQQRGLALWAALLSAVVCLSFLPVSRLVSVLFLLAVLGLILALWIVARRRAEHDVDLRLDDLPEATYRQPVVLVCGDLPLACMQQSPVLTVTQGCWIRVEEHQDLQQVARQILGLRPDWGRQLSVMVSVCPQKHADSERLTRRLLALRWQISQLRKETGHSVPLVLNGQVGSAMTNDLLWQAAIPGEGVRVWRASSAPGSVAAWVTTGGAPAMQQQVLMNSLMSWFRLHVKAVFIDESPDVPVIAPVAVLWGLGPILAGSLATSVWTAWLSAHPHETKTPHSARWVYVAQQQHQPKIKVQTAALARRNKWQFFSAGMFTMLLISMAAVGGWQYLHRPDPLQAQLVASLAPVPATLTSQQRDVLRQRTSLPPALLADTQQQLSRLEQLAPDWNIAYGQQLVEQAQVLWPEQAGSLSARWQHQLEASTLPAQNLAAWHQGMMKLAQLSERLNGLDEQKGKYITVSELKSSVFGMMNRFQQAEPIEEQLRQIHSLPASAPQRQQLIRQLEQHLRSQIYTLWQMKNSIEVAEGDEQ